jgi:hypothetical protein
MHGPQFGTDLRFQGPGRQQEKPLDAAAIPRVRPLARRIRIYGSLTLNLLWQCARHGKKLANWNLKQAPAFLPSNGFGPE